MARVNDLFLLQKEQMTYRVKEDDQKSIQRYYKDNFGGILVYFLAFAVLKVNDLNGVMFAWKKTPQQAMKGLS